MTGRAMNDIEPKLPAAFERAMQALDAQPVDGTCKGLPPTLAPIAFREIGQQGWNLLNQDLAFPVAVLKRSAVQNNREWMKAFLRHTGARIAPHVKTSMSPQLFQAQLEDGAWALTAATANQVAVLRRFGVPRILIANQVLGRQNVALLFDELAREEGAELLVIVDSASSLEALLEGGRGRALKRRLGVLLEVGAPGGRTGLRDAAEACALAQRIAGSDIVELRGLESYESVFPGLPEEDKLPRIERMLQAMLGLASDCLAAGWFAAGEIVLSSGGSEYFDIVVKRLSEWRAPQGQVVVIRSGCYLAHDHLAYARAFDRLLARQPELDGIAPHLAGALEVWGIVQSRPEPGTFIVTVGKRDISFDFEMPVARLHYRPAFGARPRALDAQYRVTRLNDQHAFVQCDAQADVQVGDLIGFGISHPCTTFDKWQLIPVVDDAYDVRSAIRTFF
ncbi:amino acid deaminase [Pseudomonas sp. UMC631]|nr:amino acid deaminase [Pseudomonas sp. UMA643]NTY18900.1 amino acid deaminase [Pseudomonas sp. UMC3103]NTY25915.1 amino acid deaminase [Pseudomonas sp. UMA603]NTY31336.1 amino acid deaminase [Pseudomonas sp. UMC3129]NTY53821.1 amino acid deaminase [Pseudomonas sp. UMC631]NTY66797.1 amino acid deaminase [Pseudomonas sp. UMC3106]NUA35830.1 amino acid deaminase [Pseudomonas sp. UMA601]